MLLIAQMNKSKFFSRLFHRKFHDNSESEISKPFGIRWEAINYMWNQYSCYGVMFLYHASHILYFYYLMLLLILKLCEWIDSGYIENNRINRTFAHLNCRSERLDCDCLKGVMPLMPLMQFFCHRMKTSFEMVSASAIVLTLYTCLWITFHWSLNCSFI